MKTLIAIGGLIALASGIVLYYRHTRRTYDDLKATCTALRSVTSWHEEYEGPGGNSVTDAVCPIGVHSVVDDPGGTFTPTHREYFYTPKHIYFRSPDRWTGLGGTPADQCTPPLHLDAVGIAMPFEVLMLHAHIQAQDVRTVGSESCRDYHVETVWREFTICINQNDHLPREIVSSLLKDEKGNLVHPERAVYSKWNNVSRSDFPEDIPTDDPSN